MRNEISPTEDRQIDDELVLMVAASILSHYDGEIETNNSPDQDGGIFYYALDGDHIRELLVDLWGDRVHSDVIERVYTELTAAGVDRECWTAVPEEESGIEWQDD